MLFYYFSQTETSFSVLYILRRDALYRRENEQRSKREPVTFQIRQQCVNCEQYIMSRLVPKLHLIFL